MTKTFDISVGEDSEFLTMTFDEFVNWCAGQLILSIGKGNFQDTIYNVVRYAGDWRVHNLINKQ